MNLPEIVIIGVDPSTVFSENSEKFDERLDKVTLFTEINRFLDHLRYMGMIPKIFRGNNLKVLLGLSTSYHATDEKKGNREIQRIDGISLSTLVDTQTMDEQFVDALALQGEINGISPITPERTRAFEMYIHTLRERNVTPILVCAPYHPLRYAKYQKAKVENQKITSLEDFEKYIQDFAKRNEILLIGSYDPYKYNMTSTDFIDGIHPKPQTIAKIISAHSHELYDLLYTDMYTTYEEYATVLAKSQSELFL
jgi:hypothetical protein